MRRLCTLLLLFSALAIGCAATPRGDFSPAALAGARAAASLERDHGGLIAEHPDGVRLTRLARELATQADGGGVTGCPSVRVLRSRAANAFSLPAGRIYVTIGLLERLGGDDELAAVIAHELSHIMHADSLRPSASPMESAERELRADREAIDLLRRVDRDPQAMLRVLEVIRGEQPPGLAASRINAAQCPPNTKR